MEHTVSLPFESCSDGAGYAQTSKERSSPRATPFGKVTRAHVLLLCTGGKMKIIRI